MRFGEREEVGLGALVCLLGVGLLVYVHSGTAQRGKAEPGYALSAEFRRTDGLVEGAMVRLAGIDVGTVARMELVAGFRAKAVFAIRDGVRVPSDSAAVIHTDGLFGSKYIEIEPGGAEDYLKNGDRLSYTQDSLMVDDLLERLVGMAESQQEKCAAAMAEGKGAPSAPGKGD